MFRTDRAVGAMFRLKLNVESRVEMITRGFVVQLKQIDIAGEQALFNRGGVLPGESRVQHRCLDPVIEESCDLVAHQRNQWRDYDTAALA